MKKLVSTFLAMSVAFSTMLSAGAVNANLPEMENMDEFMYVDGENSKIVKVRTEYEMAILATERMEAIQSRTASLTPLEEYEIGFSELAAESRESLIACGYSDEQVDAMKAYLDGELSFEEAATRASAELTTTLECLKHTKSKYTVEYSWEWDQRPSKHNEECVALGLLGIDEDSDSFETVIVSKSARIEYYDGMGEFYESDNPSISADPGQGSGVSVSYDSYPVDSTGLERLWTKAGFIRMSCEPIMANASFAAAKVRGEMAKTSGNDLSASFSFAYIIGQLGLVFTWAEDLKFPLLMLVSLFSIIMVLKLLKNNKK